MTEAKRAIRVAVGVVRAADGAVLLARRAAHQHQGGLWEFPGGKVESGESVPEALARELDEELGIRVENSRPLLRVSHDYGDRQVILEVREVLSFRGEPLGREQQPLRWVPVAELDNFAFPLANQPILRALQLPGQYLITPSLTRSELLYQGVLQAVDQGISLIQLRAPDLLEAEYLSLARRLLDRLGGRATLLLKGTPDWIARFPEAGWHLTGRQLQQEGAFWRERVAAGKLAASCHTFEDLQQASDLGLDLVTLSPIRPTRSHPGQPGMGWEQAATLLAQAACPAYLLGGVGPEDLLRARGIGARGVAGIRAFWPVASAPEA